MFNQQSSTVPLRHALWAVWLLLISVTLFSGCGGCGCTRDPIAAQREKARREAEEKAKKLEEERKKREKPKPDFEIGRFMTQPNELETVESTLKPGHWSSATVEVTANNFDFLGELVTDPFPLDDMPYNLGTSRPVTLAKGQKKYLELTYYVPPGKKGQSLMTRLLSRGEHELASAPHPMVRMPDYQFYFFVLSRDPDRYQFLKDLDSVRPPSGAFLSGNEDLYYRVKLPRIDNRVPLPSNPLCWTSIAYLLWDDLHPDTLTPEQQQAMLDWVHWGGQLIVSGPSTLENLKGSFVEPYLPAAGGGAMELNADMLAELNKNWTLKGPELRPASPWSGIQLVKHPAAEVLVKSGEEPLLVERRLGHGRIVLSAFRLGQRELQDWKSFDGFLNACLLRRLPRRFALSPQAEVQVYWVEDVTEPPGPSPPPQRDMYGRFLNEGDIDAPRRLNPRRVSSLRYFTRDTHVPQTEFDRDYRVQQMAADIQNQPSIDAAEAMRLAREAIDALRGGEEIAAIGSGVAGWNDRNAVARLARSSLTGGIVIPDAKFVVWVLGVYLAVLVPLNWAVFRSLGRVEWAWIAAPLITIGFAVAVVKLAQLDVGFVRTKSEVGVVEVQAGYPRAHVTRYTALYTSLSTTYDLRFSDPSALVQPFPNRGEMLKEQSRTTVNYRRDQGGASQETESYPIGLDGFDVTSNSQAMLHSEHMVDLGGTLHLKTLPNGSLQVVNDTHLKLQGAGVLGPEGVAWIGTLEPGAAAELKFEPRKNPEDLVDEGEATIDTPGGVGMIDPLAGETSKPAGGAGKNEANLQEEPWLAEREASPTTASRFPPEVLNVRHLVRLAQNTTKAGEIRLVAWTDEEIPGVKIEPSSSQARHSSVVVAHLKPPTELPPQRDVNTHLEVKASDFEPEPETE